MRGGELHQCEKKSPSPLLHRIACALALAACTLPAVATDTLRVCADPDNLPFSAADGSGFENRIAQLVAHAMDREVDYYWLPDRRGFIRKTLGAHECDVVMGVPVAVERTLATPPYYRAPYVFVYPSSVLRDLTSLDDPQLAHLRIGIALVGNDLAATPPALALAAHGYVDNVTGFPMFGDGPVAQRIVAAIAEGTLDVGVLWGPQAGWFARRAQVPLAVTPITAGASLPTDFAIGMGVRRGDGELARALAQTLLHLQPEIDAVLDEYAVPRLPLAPRAGGS
ncbi:MAG: quinoprotein dehydrogenase-associated putative ABC transporter substrate-binding protein [Burkholderiales bacterium]